MGTIGRLPSILIGALATAGVIVSASHGAGGSQDLRGAVWGGGHFEGTIGDVDFVRDFSVNVVQGRFGEGTFVYGRNGVIGVVNSVSCVAVSGSHVVIGGVNPAGFKYVWYGIDNGTPESGTRDAATPMLQLDGHELAQMPAGFPKVCPSPTEILGDTPAFAVTHGDLVVRDFG